MTIDTTIPHSRDTFMKTYEILRDELLNDECLTVAKDSKQAADAQQWFKEVMDYNVPGGKLNRGLAVYDVIVSLKGETGVTEREVFLADSLGWCIEWLQAFFLVADDIMDGSITRRGQPCWYRQPKVGMVACNDYLLLERCIYSILRRHFKTHPAYADLVDLFHEVTFQTCHGQLLDLTTAPIGSVDLTKYTLDNYMRIVTYKTAFYSFYLPVACGMILAGITDPKAYDLAKEILIEMGQYFQVQDDYLDCYGSPEVIGKVGTDIEDNKCSWLICSALQIASPEQKAVIEECYGHKEPEKVARIKALYLELNVEQKYLDYENASYEKLAAAIEQQTLLPKAVFNGLLKKIYKRTK
eukprot:CAMPEP_0175056390 /NCGR_PEP_ID=MMETSP0052_2-20121109/10642_1 /TAXON_ID=51329 ORGANISM="Polytomella parva, Strain SAG 63-3" /NCGR_SAMPLE_ID=MMETSP0052_2 /ASSEMBLY_ACC=CAM_ASM_000194 /LENGTH=354 /DNA_ID=CAMNT_0016321407 /DNA_START=2121 /DNA_END=3185 /DNA_ORIENTATION=-